MCSIPLFRWGQGFVELSASHLFSLFFSARHKGRFVSHCFFKSSNWKMLCENIERGSYPRVETLGISGCPPAGSCFATWVESCGPFRTQTWTRSSTELMRGVGFILWATTAWGRPIKASITFFIVVASWGNLLALLCPWILLVLLSLHH